MPKPSNTGTRVVTLTEGMEKRGGQNAAPTKPKPNLPPPKQK